MYTWFSNSVGRFQLNNEAFEDESAPILVPGRQMIIRYWLMYQSS